VCGGARGWGVGETGTVGVGGGVGGGGWVEGGGGGGGRGEQSGGGGKRKQKGVGGGGGLRGMVWGGRVAGAGGWAAVFIPPEKAPNSTWFSREHRTGKLRPRGLSDKSSLGERLERHFYRGENASL